MTDVLNEFLAAGVTHYGDAYSAVRAFREEMTLALADALQNYKGAFVPAGRAKSASRGFFMFASIDGAWGGEKGVGLEVGLRWDERRRYPARLYAGFTSGARDGVELALKTTDLFWIKDGTHLWLCTAAPTDGRLATSIWALIAVLDQPA